MTTWPPRYTAPSAGDGKEMVGGLTSTTGCQCGVGKAFCGVSTFVSPLPFAFIVQIDARPVRERTYTSFAPFGDHAGDSYASADGGLSRVCAPPSAVMT